jgi:hypothetical protein
MEDQKKLKIDEGRKTKVRNLSQFKKMTDDEFEEYWSNRTSDIVVDAEFETRIKSKIDDFAEDYDLGDLKSNDKLVLRALAQAYITLEDLEKYSYVHRLDGLSDSSSVSELEKLNNVMSNLRKDISNMQGDLKITRKVRKGDKEESVINYIEDLKVKAKKFYAEKLFYIFCPKCSMLVSTTWFLWPEEFNKLSFHCKRCNEKFSVHSQELLDKKGVNIDSVPDSFK